MYLFLLKKYCYRGSNYLFLHYSMAQSIKIMFAIAIFITHALQGYVPVDIIWNTYLDQKIQKRKIFWEYVCRTIITLSTCKFCWLNVFFNITFEVNNTEIMKYDTTSSSLYYALFISSFTILYIYLFIYYNINCN